MAKKKEIKKIFENLELESSEADANINEPAGDQAQPSDIAGADEKVSQERLMAAKMPEEQPEQYEGKAAQVGEQGLVPNTGKLSAGETESESEEDNSDDLLDDVRKSLLEEEAEDQGKDQKWWRRFGKSNKRKGAEEEIPQAQEEINLPALTALETVEQEAGTSQAETDEYQDQLDDLLDMLDTEDEPPGQESAVVPYGTAVQPAPEPEVTPEKPVDIEDLKKQAFQPRPMEANENLTEVRSIALGGEDEVFVEVEAKSPDQFEERLNAAENALKPYQRYINFAFAFLGIVMAAIAVFLIYNAYQRSVAQAAPTALPSDLPYPTTVSLPGGWQFALGKGGLTSDGSWNPSGAEWLQGTEVCRWVALPWSRQLEAVIRTLNPDDPIELGMSNNDKLTYNVYSVKQMSPAEMLKLDSNKPCLLVVLAEPDAEKRWVLTALP